MGFSLQWPWKLTTQQLRKTHSNRQNTIRLRKHLINLQPRQAFRIKRCKHRQQPNTDVLWRYVSHSRCINNLSIVHCVVALLTPFVFELFKSNILGVKSCVAVAVKVYHPSLTKCPQVCLVAKDVSNRVELVKRHEWICFFSEVREWRLSLEMLLVLRA